MTHQSVIDVDAADGMDPSDVEPRSAHWRVLFEHLADAVFLMDPVSRKILDVNDEACRCLGYTRDELIGMHSSEFVGRELTGGQVEPVSDDESAALLREALTRDEPMTITGACRRKDGTVFPVEARVGLIRADGRILTLVTQRDTGERREAERSLQESRERFRSLVETAPDAIYLVAADGRFVDVNQEACANTGYTRDELLARHVWDIAPTTSYERLLGFREKIRGSGSITVGSYHRRKDGSMFPVEVRLGLFEHGDETCHLAVVRDVSDRIRAEEERRQMALEIGYLQEELEMTLEFSELVGTSRPMNELCRTIEQVAPTDATVLISGETGTGKELVARAIHGTSQRRDRTLVKVNCAALSPGLIESELFGHERGAFTGAIERRIGRFELSDGGTIFLDEIGDLSADLQAKLLRVLQEGEFERVGGKKTMRSDVRVIAATNRDLQRAIEEGKFREDLFYRLNVVPIRVPPLRERPEDIPLLIAHFARRLSTKLGKNLEAPPANALDRIKRYGWPGNVRELEHAVERAAVVSRGPSVDLDAYLRHVKPTVVTDPSARLDDVQRKHILDVLERTAWRVSGPRGAAQVLGLKATTLNSRMKKLGIRRPDDR